LHPPRSLKVDGGAIELVVAESFRVGVQALRVEPLAVPKVDELGGLIPTGSGRAASQHFRGKRLQGGRHAADEIISNGSRPELGNHPFTVQLHFQFHFLVLVIGDTG
jgi:hypothetical protein